MDSDDGPEGRCGFVLEPGDVHEDVVADESEAGSDEWYEYSSAVCCWREAWDGGDGNRCIWHAESDDKPADALVAARADGPERLDGASVPAVQLGDAIDFEACGLQAATFEGTGLREGSFAGVDGRRAQFPDADLPNAQFSDAYLVGAEFPGADLRRAAFPDADLRDAQFPDADLWDAQFPGADLGDAQFPGAYLPGAQFPDAYLFSAQFPDATLWDAQFPGTNLIAADLTDADARGATFTNATLDGATLRDADLGNADLTGARLHDAHLLDVRINDATEFDGVIPEEADAGWFDGPIHAVRPRLRWWLTLLRLDANDHARRHNHLDRSHTVYRTIQRLYRENSMPRRIDTYYVRARDTRRKQAILAGDPVRWLYLAGQRWVMGYGERPLRVVATSLAVVGLSALLYPLWGMAVGKATGPPPRVIGYPFDGVGLVTGLGKSLYLSVITFTTLGYGDVQPLGHGEALATAESLVGAFLMALLVFVLGRRATR